MSGFFMDGTGVTPGTDECKCGPGCEFPCWQRLGIAPACSTCGCTDDEPETFTDEDIEYLKAEEKWNRDIPRGGL